MTGVCWKSQSREKLTITAACPPLLPQHGWLSKRLGETHHLLFISLFTGLLLGSSLKAVMWWWWLSVDMAR